MASNQYQVTDMQKTSVPNHNTASSAAALNPGRRTWLLHDVQLYFAVHMRMLHLPCCAAR